MKEIIAILCIFTIVGLGVGAFFISQSIIKTNTLPTTLAKEGVKPLEIILDDCNFKYADECTPTTDNGTLENQFTLEIGQILQTQSNPNIQSYTETIPGTNSPLPVANIIANVSYNSRINYRTILTMLDLREPSFFNSSQVTPIQAVSREEQTFHAQLTGMTTELNQLYNTEFADHSTEIVAHGKTYKYAPEINTSSRALYAYFALHTSSIIEFERMSGINTGIGVKSFPKLWQTLFREDPVSSSPYHLPFQH